MGLSGISADGSASLLASSLLQGDAVGVSVLNKSLDASASEVLSLLSSLPPTNPHLGSKLDVKL